MPQRSEVRDRAKAEYLARRAAGETVRLKELAEQVGASYQAVRNWKSRDGWDRELPKKKQGGQPKNRNSRGHKNALGNHGGAPAGNKNAEKDGAYSAVFLDMLTPAERALAESAPTEGREALEHEMQILKYREHKILTKLAEYENARQEELYLNSVMKMGGTDMETHDTAFSRALKLQEALYKVQGRIAKIADSLRAIEDGAQRLTLERERLELMRLRAVGAVELDDPAGEEMGEE